MNYYIADGDQRRGPFPEDQLISQGLRPDLLVWQEGMPDWLRADAVPELRPLFGSPGGPPPVRPPGAFPPVAPTYGGPTHYDQSAVSSKRVMAGVFGILLGSFGVHKFVLGMTVPGIIMLAVTLCTCGFGGIAMGPIGLIEGIIYLTKSDDEFYRQYIVEQRAWF